MRLSGISTSLCGSNKTPQPRSSERVSKARFTLSALHRFHFSKQKQPEAKQTPISPETHPISSHSTPSVCLLLAALTLLCAPQALRFAKGATATKQTGGSSRGPTPPHPRRHQQGIYEHALVGSGKTQLCAGAQHHKGSPFTFSWLRAVRENLHTR